MRLKELLTEKNLTQAKIANMLGVSRTTVTMWEAGASQPDNETLLQIADILGTSVDELLGSTKKALTPKEVNALPEAQALREVMETLSPEDRQRVLEFGRGLAATAHKPKPQK